MTRRTKKTRYKPPARPKSITLTALESVILREALQCGGRYAVEAIKGVGPKGGRFTERVRAYGAAKSLVEKGLATVVRQEIEVCGRDLHMFLSIALTARDTEQGTH